MEQKAYKTLLCAACDEYIVNKSRFLCYATPAKTQEAALAFLEKIRTRHKDATHNCYAYVIGKNAGIMRYSDDGEPSGTAGLPMMEVIKKQCVMDCAVVITRYFGGVLLGAGGLVRAYSNACALALKKAQVVEMLPSQTWLMEVEYKQWDKVAHALKSLPVKLKTTEFATSVTATLGMRQADADDVISSLNALTNASAEWLKIEDLYAPWESQEDV